MKQDNARELRICHSDSDLPTIAAEIGSIDLTSPLPNKQVEELHRAFIEYQVIFFRDQKVGFDDLVRLGRYFGTLHRHVGASTISKVTENEFVRALHYDETSTQIAGENFHSDQSRAPIPPLGSILYLHTVSPNGRGDTYVDGMEEQRSRFWTTD